MLMCGPNVQTTPLESAIGGDGLDSEDQKVILLLSVDRWEMETLINQTKEACGMKMELHACVHAQSKSIHDRVV